MWPNSQFTADLVTFTKKIMNEKLHFCAVCPGKTATKWSFKWSTRKHRWVFLHRLCEKSYNKNWFIWVIGRLSSLNLIVKKVRAFDVNSNEELGVLRRRKAEAATKSFSEEKVFWNYAADLHPCRSVIAKQLYWNHTSAWVFSRKFAAYFQNTFF